jgi:hypothetical protein
MLSTLNNPHNFNTSNRAPHAEVPDVIDRTQVLDPLEFWPKPTDCPDWKVFTGITGKRGAEMRLEAIGQALNRGAGKLRSPTEKERLALIAQTFRRSGSDWHQRFGIMGLSSASHMVYEDANLIVEACFLRGYMRKLEVQEDDQKSTVSQQALHRARRTLDNYRDTARPQIEEFHSLAEAAARHQQRLDDEKAFDRSADLRRQVANLHRDAVAAAHTLGLSVPDAPEFL